jgi:hypothetical protein
MGPCLASFPYRCCEQLIALAIRGWLLFEVQGMDQSPARQSEGLARTQTAPLAQLCWCVRLIVERFHVSFCERVPRNVM